MQIIINYSLTDPGYYHMKREGITDPSVKSKTEEQIKTFFNEEYDNIVERELAQNNDDDFITDKIITEQMQVQLTILYDQFIISLGNL